MVWCGFVWFVWFGVVWFGLLWLGSGLGWLGSAWLVLVLVLVCGLVLIVVPWRTRTPQANSRQWRIVCGNFRPLIQ